MPEFYMILARKINKIPEFYIIGLIAQKIFCQIFFLGGGTRAPCPQFPTPMIAIIARELFWFRINQF